MEHVTISVVCAALIGFLMHFFLIAAKLQKKKRLHEFSITKWWQENWASAGLAMLAGIASIMFAPTLTGALNVDVADGSLFYEAHAFLSGFLPYAGFEKVFKVNIEDEVEKD